MKKIYEVMNVSSIMNFVVGGLLITCGIAILVNGIIVSREKSKILF